VCSSSSGRAASFRDDRRSCMTARLIAIKCRVYFFRPVGMG